MIKRFLKCTSQFNYLDILINQIRFSPPGIPDNDVSSTWLYDETYRQWSRWLPLDVKPTVEKGGYYTALVHPGLRIVSMNMNYCYTDNWWLLYDSKDPAEGLAWLQKVLEEAEIAGEKVFNINQEPSNYFDSSRMYLYMRSKCLFC